MDGDCDDGDSAVNPGAEEVCDGIDQNCTDGADEGVELELYVDGDRDGYGIGDPVFGCTASDGLAIYNGDCDDLNDAVYPGADELCDEVDNDCDDQIDEGLESTWYVDTDGDGFGDSPVESCEQSEGTAALGGDCDDTDPDYNPDALEPDCTDPNDYNCDGSVRYADADGDGFAACEECDDTNAAVYPGATETCDGLDNDCDGTADNGATDAPSWYTDSDGDGFGDIGGARTVACEQPSGMVADSTDCNDALAAVNPAATEICNDLDDDCDGTADLGAVDEIIWYYDGDGDGYGATSSVSECDAPYGYVAATGDCDDTNDQVNPGATEVCGDADMNCDGSGFDADGDADGWQACEDCNDADTFVNP